MKPSRRSFLAASALAGVTPLAVPSTASAAVPVIASTTARNGTKGYLLVDGKPWLMLGVQSFGEWQTFGNDLDPDNVPTDQDHRILPQDWLENTFEKTRAAGFNTIQIALAWSAFEPTTPGVYDWTVIDKYLAWARKYNLRIDWVFGGANTNGGGIIEGQIHGFMKNIPDYVSDIDTYWGAGRVGGEQWMPYMPISASDAHYTDAKYLFDSEAAAVHALFNHLAAADTARSTILFQIFNEPDAFPYWSSGAILTTWLRLADQLGAAIKTADYVCATRMNFKRGNWPTRQAAITQFAGLANIDFVGLDSYSHDPVYQHDLITQLAAITDIAYLPETGGASNNKTVVLAAVLAAGGFMNLWQLNDSWVRNEFGLYGRSTSDVAGFVSYTQWQLGTIPPMPASTVRLKDFQTGLRRMVPVVTRAEAANMAAFNIDDATADRSYTAAKTVGSASVQFTTTTGDVALAVYDPPSNSIFVTSDTAGSVTVNLGVGRSARIGQINAAGNWNTSTVRAAAANGDIALNRNEVMRVPLG